MYARDITMLKYVGYVSDLLGPSPNETKIADVDQAQIE